VVKFLHENLREFLFDGYLRRKLTIKKYFWHFGHEQILILLPVDYDTSILPVDYDTSILQVDYDTSILQVDYDTSILQVDYDTSILPVDYDTPILPNPLVV
jgi:hypothetical protein